MAATQTTPGPWEIDRTGTYYGKPNIRRHGIVLAWLPDNSAGLVRPADRLRAKTTDEANARLIVAAPYMATILRELIAEWDTPTEAAPHGRNDTGAVALARHALALIDGEAK